jgi:hypothetical protein
MVIISSVNNTNYSGLSTPGHIIGVGSGLSGVTGLTSNSSGSTTITTINNVVSGNSYNNEELDAKFQTIKDCLVASDLKMTNMFSKVKCDFDEINEALVASDIKTTNMFSKVDCDFDEVKECLVASDLKIVNMFSKLSSELDIIRIEINMNFEEGMLPISEDDLNIIYECFIIPYINCEIYRMGSIKQLIDLNITLNSLIKTTTAPKTKLVLMIFKDILCVLSNVRNEHIKYISIENQLKQLREKYNKCHLLVDQLKQKLDDITNDRKGTIMACFTGRLNVELWKPPRFEYLQAKFNLDMAWYKFLYNTDKVDLDKYHATVAYVRSFGTKEKALKELYALLDEKFKTFEDDLKNSIKE